MSDPLEDMLAKQESRYVDVISAKADPSPSNGIQTAEKSASLFDFIKMVNKVVSKTMQDLKVEFIPDENKNIIVSPDLQLDHPIITYKVIYRKPKGELKPRVRQQIYEKSDDPNDDRLGEIYGQKFKCLIQFNVFASVYDLAEQVMEEFEEQIFTYTGFFKKNGVSEILFEEQATDSSYDMYRQTISVRNIRYIVEVEKLIAMFQEKLKEVETLGL